MTVQELTEIRKTIIRLYAEFHNPGAWQHDEDGRDPAELSSDVDDALVSLDVAILKAAS